MMEENLHSKNKEYEELMQLVCEIIRNKKTAQVQLKQQKFEFEQRRISKDIELNLRRKYVQTEINYTHSLEKKMDKIKRDSTLIEEISFKEETKVVNDSESIIKESMNEEMIMYANAYKTIIDQGRCSNVSDIIQSYTSIITTRKQLKKSTNRLKLQTEDLKREIQETDNILSGVINTIHQSKIVNKNRLKECQEYCLKIEEDTKKELYKYEETSELFYKFNIMLQKLVTSLSLIQNETNSSINYNDINSCMQYCIDNIDCLINYKGNMLIVDKPALIKKKTVKNIKTSNKVDEHIKILTRNQLKNISTTFVHNEKLKRKV